MLNYVTSVSELQRPEHKNGWNTGTTAVFCLEFWFSSLGRSGCLYMELGILNSGKVTKLHLKKSFEILLNSLNLVNTLFLLFIRTRLHQASASTLRQLYNDALELSCNPFLSDSIDFNENRITSIIAKLFGVDGPSRKSLYMCIYTVCNAHPYLKFYEGVGLNCKASLRLSAITVNLC